VVVHIHDIRYPFEYPHELVGRGVAWNESYLLRAFLMYNAVFEIEFFPSCLQQLYTQAYLAAVPMGHVDWGSSFWMRRRG
jgi:hypothetical protein